MAFGTDNKCAYRKTNSTVPPVRNHLKQQEPPTTETFWKLSLRASNPLGWWWRQLSILPWCLKEKTCTFSTTNIWSLKIALPQRTDGFPCFTIFQRLGRFEHGEISWFYDSPPCLLSAGWVEQCLLKRRKCTLQGINISHLGKRKIIDSKCHFLGDMLVFWRVSYLNKQHSTHPLPYTSRGSPLRKNHVFSRIYET